MKEYNLTFSRTYFVKSDSDWRDGYSYAEFEEVGSRKIIRFNARTKTMQAASLVKGMNYAIKTDELDNVIFVSGNNKEVTKYGGRIIVHDLKTGKHFDNSNGREVDKHFNPTDGQALYDGGERQKKAAYNKFAKGIMSEELLLKMNNNDTYFHVHYYDPQDKRKSGGHSSGYGSRVKKNYILVEKETQKEIDSALKSIQSQFMNPEIKPYFEINTRILPIKKKR